MAGRFHERHEVRERECSAMADPKHPRKFNEKFKHQMVKLYDNGKSTS